jgi:cell division protein ZapE
MTTTARAKQHATAAAPRGIAGYLAPILAARATVLDRAQEAAVARLQRLADELAEFRAARQSKLKRLFAAPDVPRGIYLWGGVGRGKSFLMDGFFAAVPIRRKTRVHFHAFMRDVHAELGTLKREADPLAAVAQRIAHKWRLVCFDEFHVSDIADAMILGRLLSALFEHGVVFVMTSNYPPDKLYPNGLQRQHLLPTIALLRRQLDVLEVDGGVDYRLRVLERVQTYHCPPSPAVDAAMAATFEAMRTGPDEPAQLAIEGRTLHTVRRAGSAVWFDFAALCDGPRSQRDYLELARRFSVLLLANVPRMSAEMGDRARRFTWLVDILYDHRVKLVVSAAVPPAELYVDGPNSHEFPRTASRLAEMQTHDYMALPHLAGTISAGAISAGTTSAGAKSAGPPAG